jgi:hypothetical protein
MLRTGASFSALRGLGRCGPAAAAAAWASHQQRWVGGSAAAQAAQPLPAHDESADAAPHGAVSALLLDAAGTLIIPSESVGAAYSRYAAAHGFSVGSEMEVVQRFRVAYNAPPVPQPSYGGGVQQAGPLRYNGDARDFWSRVVTVSTGVDHPALAEVGGVLCCLAACGRGRRFRERGFVGPGPPPNKTPPRPAGPLQDLYQYYTRPEAWRLADGALPALQRLKRAGLKTACVSNFVSGRAAPRPPAGGRCRLRAPAPTAHRPPCWRRAACSPAHAGARDPAGHAPAPHPGVLGRESPV